MKNIASDVAMHALRAVALPDVCRVEDLAHHLHTSASVIRSALRRGEIPGRRVGKRWLIARQALIESLAMRPDVLEGARPSSRATVPLSVVRSRRRTTPTGR